MTGDLIAQRNHRIEVVRWGPDDELLQFEHTRGSSRTAPKSNIAAHAVHCPLSGVEH